MPGALGTKLHALLPSIDFESHVASRAVAVCGTKSVFEKTLTHSQSELIHLLVRQPSARMFNRELTPAALQQFKPAAE